MEMRWIVLIDAKYLSNPNDLSFYIFYVSNQCLQRTKSFRISILLDYIFYKQHYYCLKNLWRISTDKTNGIFKFQTFFTVFSTIYFEIIINFCKIIQVRGKRKSFLFRFNVPFYFICSLRHSHFCSRFSLIRTKLDSNSINSLLNLSHECPTGAGSNQGLADPY